MSKTIENSSYHSLAISPEDFLSVFIGEKKFEILKNDKAFKVGDFLKLNEYSNMYTGNYSIKRIEYINKSEISGLDKDFIVVSLSEKCYVSKIDTWINRETIVSL